MQLQSLDTLTCFPPSPFPLKSTEIATSSQLFTELPAVLQVTVKILLGTVILGVPLLPGMTELQKTTTSFSGQRVYCCFSYIASEFNFVQCIHFLEQPFAETI